MSGLIVGLVLRTPITKFFNSEAKFVATVYADHAWEDGTHAYPSVATVAAITGYAERTVQRYVHALVEMGMLVPDGQGPRGTNRYKFPLEAGKDGSVRLAFMGGVTVTPRQADGGDRDSGDRDSGVSLTPEQLNHQNLVVVVSAGEVFKIYEREMGVITPMIADAIEDACKVYSPEWVTEAMGIAVKANKRNWKYVEGILKNCKAKGVRPSLNTKEKTNGSNGTDNHKRTGKAETPAYTADDHAAAERVRKRRAAMPAV